MSAKHFGFVVVLVAAVGAGYFAGQRGGEQAKVGAGDTASAAAASSGERKILYYRNPMGQPDTSPVPKKDSMGMDYIPVYADEAAQAAKDEPGTVSISPARVQKLGVRTARVERRVLDQQLRAVGRIELDERRVVTVAPRFEGWIEHLHVAATGQPVKKGQPLFDVYSPELVSVQREIQTAREGLVRLADAPADARESMQRLLVAGQARLANWGLDAAQIAALEKDGKAGGARRTFRFTAPASGIVLEKKAVQGMRFMPGEMLYQIADVSHVWVIADVFERDAAQVKVGQGATVRVASLGGREFAGRVDYIYPTLNAATRTVPVRIELANSDGALRPAMYAEAELKVGGEAGVSRSTASRLTNGLSSGQHSNSEAGKTASGALVVPSSAILDGGQTQRVLLVRGEGRFAPKEVKLGRSNGDAVEVLGGLAEGDEVVVAANFLIDSESQLKAVFSGLTADQAPAKATHHAQGVIDAINPDGSVTVTHEPVSTLKWPAMTMDFVPAAPDLLHGLKPGARVAFDFAEGKPGEWRIVGMKPAAGKESSHAH
jgi:Cu(I)/Ag(I) efflux system membrane fusion protein